MSHPVELANGWLVKQVSLSRIGLVAIGPQMQLGSSNFSCGAGKWVVNKTGKPFWNWFSGNRSSDATWK